MAATAAAGHDDDDEAYAAMIHYNDDIHYSLG